MASIKTPRRAITDLHQFLHKSLSSPFSQNPFLDTPSIHPHSFAEAIIEALQEPIIIIDESLNIIAANKPFFKTFKFHKKQILHNNLRDLSPVINDIAIVIKKIQLFLHRRTKFEPFELTQEFPTIGERTVLLNAKRIEVGEYKTNFILLTVNDITKRKKIDQQKDDFVGYVTHELKTPITTAYAFLQILDGYHKKTNDKKSQFLIAKTLTQMQRLTDLLNSFTNVYRAQTGKMSINRQEFDITKLVHEIIEAFEYTGNSHGIILQGKISETIQGDKEKIREVINNLITNAIKYSPKAKEVKIILEEDLKSITIHVRDFGVGLSKEEQEKVFERLYRVKGKFDKKIEGLGLGLYLAATIIKAHKGTFWLKSKPGEGSTFSFSVPKNTNC